MNQVLGLDRTAHDAGDDAIRFAFPCKTTSPLNGSQGASKGAAMAAARTRNAHRAQGHAQTMGEFLRAQGSPGFNRDRVWIGLPATVKLTRVAPSNGLDDDNLRGALKSVRDGIADALGVDDRDPRVTWEYDQRRGKPREYAVEVEIRRMVTD